MKRIYETTMSVENVKDAKKKEAEENTNHLRLLNTEKTKTFTFSLSKFPENKLQLSPKKQARANLLIHRLKPYIFLQDLRIFRELAGVLEKPISFKLDLEMPQSKDDVNELENANLAFISYLLKSEEKRKKHSATYFEELLGNKKLKVEFAETMFNALAGWFCFSGICWTPDGLFKQDTPDSTYQRFPSLKVLDNLYVEILLSSGFL